MRAAINHSQLLLLLESSEEVVQLWKGTSKDAGILLTNDSTGSLRIRD